MRQATIPRLSELGTAERAKLLAIWRATIGQPPAALRCSRELLASALAWQLQERKFGGLAAATERKLRVLARRQERGKRSTWLAAAASTIRPGTVITKQWRGAEHVVTVLVDGYQYRGRVYGSLSRLAREITGTRWNGPAFFGLRKRHGRTAESDHGGQ